MMEFNKRTIDECFQNPISFVGIEDTFCYCHATGSTVSDKTTGNKYFWYSRPFKFDGHCTFSPDHEWIATDQKMKERLEQSIILYNFETDSCKTLATLTMSEKMFTKGDLRCDYHPRWSRY